MSQAQEDIFLKELLSLSAEEGQALDASIATLSSKLLSKAPAVVSVITAADIKATGADNLVDVLQGVPGIYVRSSQFADRPIIHFRGDKGTHTLLMINGTPLKDLVWAMGIYWKGLPASMIERVEIIRGPGSALFGSDAVAGVINVITKTAGKIEHPEFGVRAGSFDSQAAWVQDGGEWNGFDVNFTAEVSRTGGYNPLILADGQTAKDAGTGTNVSYAPGPAHFGWNNQDLHFSLAKGNWRLLADYMRQNEVEIGLTGGGVLDPVARGSNTRYNIDLFYKNEGFAPHWGLNAELRFVNLSYDSGAGFYEHPPGYKASVAGAVYVAGDLNRQAASERRMSFETSAAYSGIPDHAIRVGVGYVADDLYSVTHLTSNADGSMNNLAGTPNAFAPERLRSNYYLFLQDVWVLNPSWELTAGLRHEQYSDFGGTTNPRLALVWQTTERLSSKLMYGQAFRAPAYLELYSQGLSKPNPALKPERSRTLELAFDYRASQAVSLGASVYHMELSDLIAPDGTNRFQNNGDHSVRGVEFEARWRLSPNFRLAGNMTVLNQDRTPSRCYLTPDQKAYLRADWAFLPKWNWNLQANWVGERIRTASDARPPVAAYTLFDTTLRYAPDGHWEFAASIRNLFNADARDYTGVSIPYDLPLPGRSLYAELRYKF